MKQLKQKMKDRVREPSTWAGVAAIAATLVGVNPQAAATAVTGIASVVQNPDVWKEVLPVLVPAVLAIVLPERPKPQ